MFKASRVNRVLQKKNGSLKENGEHLAGGFKYLLFSPLLGEMIHFD